MKRTLILFFLLPWFVFAQQNRMWIPSEAHTAYNNMVEQGAQFPFEALYSPDKPSFNDAIVWFNGGCTGEVISPQGLILTNHHCGYGAIQSHSTLEHNYVEDGFWAKSLDEELPNPGMYVTFVRKIIDVTDKILEGVTDEMEESARQKLINANIEKVKKEIPIEKWQDVRVKSFFYGNKFYAFVEETYKDIRLVGAPPSSIGKFGADTDNWMWPRHSGDFSLFRIYADKNNRPAEYSKDNVPYKPKAYLQVSDQGVQEGDLIIVYGFPGRTQQYLPSFRVEQITEKINPVRIRIRDISLGIMDKYMRSNDTIKLKYTSHYARISNYWKKWQGENLGIKRTHAIENKKHLEKDFLESLKDHRGTAEELRILEKLKQAFKELEEPELARAIFFETAYINNKWMQRGFAFTRFEQALVSGDEKTVQKALKDLSNQISFKNDDPRVEEELFVSMMDYLKHHLPSKYMDENLKNTDYKKLAKEIKENSILASQEKFEAFLKLPKEKMQETLKTDSGQTLARALIGVYYNKINPDYMQNNSEINKLMREYMRLLFKAYPRQNFVPDANSTLRVSFGEVKGYDPRDGVHYEPISTLDGMIEKYIPGDYEFDLPEELLAIYEKKDYGKYNVNGTVPVNFLGSAHTTGGNSGSPALNAKGQLVGLNFDRVWEGTMSDLYYDPSICRNIMVDLRFVLFVIEKIGKNQRLINEINSK